MKSETFRTVAERCRYMAQVAKRDDMRNALNAAANALEAELAQPVEPVVKIVSSGQADLPILQWLSADHSFRAPIGTMLYTAAPEPVNAWQPIETAPKDGSPMILSNGYTAAQGEWTFVHETYDIEGAQDSDGFEGWTDWGGGMLPEPTHWMPLPKPPGATP